MGCGVVMTAEDKFVCPTLVLSTIGDTRSFAEACCNLGKVNPIRMRRYLYHSQAKC